MLKIEVSDEDRKILKELCELQDIHLEKLPKKLEDRVLGKMLEENMDILREVACRLARGSPPDPGYVYEKTCRMLKDLNELGFKVPKCEPDGW
jgi:hypothetical protein